MRGRANQPACSHSWGYRIVMFPLSRLLIAAAAIVLIGSFYGILRQTLGPLVPGTLGLPEYVISDPIFSASLSELIEAVAAVGILLFLAKVIEGRSLAEVGLGRRHLVRNTVLGFVLGLGLFLLLFGMQNLPVLVGVEAWPAKVAWLELSIPLVSVTFVFTCLIGVAEEVLFRGILFRILEEGLGSWLALAISASLFALVHLDPQHPSLILITPQLLGGILLGAAYMLTRSLWLPIGIHWATDFIYGMFAKLDALPSSAQTLLNPQVLYTVIYLSAGIILLSLAIRRGQVRIPCWMQLKTQT
jgi:membrane protease YdiL (CAAX protease family)